MSASFKSFQIYFISLLIFKNIFNNTRHTPDFIFIYVFIDGFKNSTTIQVSDGEKTLLQKGIHIHNEKSIRDFGYIVLDTELTLRNLPNYIKDVARKA